MKMAIVVPIGIWAIEQPIRALQFPKNKMLPNYSTDPEWSDIKPLSIPSTNSDPSLVCKIAYSHEYEEALGYFARICQLEERSQRALELTGFIIDLCPAHYTAWHYRQLCLIALSTDLRAELEFLNEFTRENKKNYQVWNHRQFIIGKLGDASHELEFIADILELDSKNYHAWTYRQWVIVHFNLSLQDEITYIDQLLLSDIRNNSAWNQRHFIIFRNGSISTQTLNDELEFSFKKIQASPNNESSWTYLRGLFHKSEEKCEENRKVIEFCHGMYENLQVKSPHLLMLLFDIYTLGKDTKHATEMLETLKQVDPIRKKYWQYLINSTGS